eukprot:8561572-Alexandrium_andersonii.AAC.1
MARDPLVCSMGGRSSLSSRVRGLATPRSSCASSKTRAAAPWGPTPAARRMETCQLAATPSGTPWRTQTVINASACGETAAQKKVRQELSSSLNIRP